MAAWSEQVDEVGNGNVLVVDEGVCRAVSVITTIRTMEISSVKAKEMLVR
jgi:hypothetical protein